MYETLTPREGEIVERLVRRFPGNTVTAEIREIERPKGPVAALHISLGPDIAVDLERAIIAWPPESPLRLVEAIEAKFEMLGLTPADSFDEASREPVRSRALLAILTPLTKLTSHLPLK